MASDERHLFIAVVPQADGSGDAPREARARLARMLDRLGEAGLLSSGMIGDPDPYTATINALELFRVDDVVISTLPDERSGWLRSNLIERVRGATAANVEHVVVDSAGRADPRAGGLGAGGGGCEHRPPGGHGHGEHARAAARPTAARGSSRSCWGCCFSSSRRSWSSGPSSRPTSSSAWPRATRGRHPARTLPVEVAGVNTAILVSSSFTIHWAEQSIKRGNRFGLKAGMLLTFLLGCSFLFIQINEYANIGFAPQDGAQETIFFSLTGLHGAHVFIGLLLLLFVTIRSFRGHYSPEEHRGVEVPGIYWHFVDIMWLVVYTTVYII